MNRILAFLAFACLAGFLGIMLIKLPRADLICLVGLTLALAAWDIVLNLREHRD